MSNRFVACKAEVLNRGAAPDRFLAELVAWGRTAPDELFARNDRHDIYAQVAPELGPWEGPLHRKAVMLEVLRVLAGFESSWNWHAGVDTSKRVANTAANEEAGAFQISCDAMGIDPSLRRFAQTEDAINDCQQFIVAMKNSPTFAIGFTARLLRLTVNHNGPVKRREINAWLRRKAVAEFMALLQVAAA